MPSVTAFVGHNNSLHHTDEAARASYERAGEIADRAHAGNQFFAARREYIVHLAKDRLTNPQIAKRLDMHASAVAGVIATFCRETGEAIPRRIGASSRSATAKRFWRMRKQRAEVTGEHSLDVSKIADTDEVSGDNVSCSVWCDTHKVYEWHWLERSGAPYYNKNYKNSSQKA